MSSPTVRKISFGCIGIIGVIFIGLIVLLTVLPSDEDGSAPAAEENEQSLAEEVRERYYDHYVTEIDGEERFESPGDFDEAVDYRVPIVDFSDSDDEHEIILTAIDMDEYYYDVLCENIQSYTYTGQLDGEDGRLELRNIVIQDGSGNVRATCEAIHMMDSE